MNFHEALRERVALLAGLDEGALASTLAGLEISPGARELLATMGANGAQCVLVSGGFTYFTRAVARQLGFTPMMAQVLEMAKGAIDRAVLDPIIDF